MEKRKLRVLMTVVIIVNLVAIALVLYQPEENRKRTEDSQLTETGALQYVTPSVEEWKNDHSEIESVIVHIGEDGYEAKLVTRNNQSLWQFKVSVTVCTKKGNMRTEFFFVYIDAYTGEMVDMSVPLIDWDWME